MMGYGKGHYSLGLFCFSSFSGLWLFIKKSVAFGKNNDLMVSFSGKRFHFEHGSIYRINEFYILNKRTL